MTLRTHKPKPKPKHKPEPQTTQLDGLIRSGRSNIEKADPYIRYLMKMLRYQVPSITLVNSFLTSSTHNNGFHFPYTLFHVSKLSSSAKHKAYIHSISSSSRFDNAVKDYIFGDKKATEVAHLLWRHVVQKGDTVVDATCGNGNDTLAMAKLVNDNLSKGCVYGLDFQEDAIKNTSHLLDLSLDPVDRKLVKLFPICHSRMAEVLPKNSCVRLVAFNLGYLPGGDKTIITKSNTTLRALEAAKEILVPGGVISVVAYVGHPGGRI
ncbi:hypothetical protein RND81_10G186200 [Saponaria officinalis]|uniref:rRNA methylase YtqB n=1 Tax=Saponaria officinalis TaxID=3572 RepID=A0AAW1I4E2_SAPOF